VGALVLTLPGSGASPLQTRFHHVLPLALPGMLTETIICGADLGGQHGPAGFFERRW